MGVIGVNRIGGKDVTGGWKFPFPLLTRGYVTCRLSEADHIILYRFAAERVPATGSNPPPYILTIIVILLSKIFSQTRLLIALYKEIQIYTDKE
jgi:hypothetical protein